MVYIPKKSKNKGENQPLDALKKTPNNRRYKRGGKKIHTDILHRQASTTYPKEYAKWLQLQKNGAIASDEITNCNIYPCILYLYVIQSGYTLRLNQHIMQ